MHLGLRILTEFSALNRILDRRDMASVILAAVCNAPEIMRSRKLTLLDASMSRNMTIRFGNVPIALPIADIDQMLMARKDNPTFGNVREIYARNCYLRRLRPKRPVRSVLDLGANRGIFSLLALMALDAEIVVGVEPTADYDSVFQLLLEANRCDAKRAPRYRRFISSLAIERENCLENVSIPTILREQGLQRFDLVKMDIEGHERIVFSDPEWLGSVDNICMELHPQAGDLSLIPRALEQYGFKYTLTDQHGQAASEKSATFLYASCTGEPVN